MTSVLSNSGYLDTELGFAWQNKKMKATTFATTCMLYTGEKKEKTLAT